jgi:hypothetical protein
MTNVFMGTHVECSTAPALGTVRNPNQDQEAVLGAIAESFFQLTTESSFIMIYDDSHVT